MSEATKEALYNSYQPFQRDARTRGIPQLGAGAVYQVAESELKVAPFVIPPTWPHAFGGDTDSGAGPTAVVWGAEDPKTKVLYIYDGFKRRQELDLNVAAIKARGDIPGVMDAAALLMTPKDAEQLVRLYRQAGINVVLPKKEVESGIELVWRLMTQGRLKVFSTLTQFFSEFRLYRRDERGRIVKKNDHYQDACLVGSTEVITLAGSRTLESLVGQEGIVLTRDGAWARFTGARCTRRDAPVVRLTFADGSAVVCTPDHPFLTPTGWQRADHMAGRDCYNGVSQRIQWSGALLQPVRSFRAVVTTCVASIFSAMESGFTGRCGPWCMVGPSPAATPSTTSITTALITSRPICSLWRAACTQAFISAGTASPSQPPPASPPPHGIDLRQAELGIARTILTRSTKSLISPATNVNSYSAPASQGRIASAQTRARPGTAFALALITRNGLAWCVAAVLWRITTWRNARARASAVLRCAGVYEAGRADVFCLSVPGPSAFCLANGAVVHNTRYLVISGMARAEPLFVEKPDEPEVIDPLSRGYNDAHAWMK